MGAQIIDGHACARRLKESVAGEVEQLRADGLAIGLATVIKPAISLGYDRQATVASVDEWASRTVGLGRHTRRADVLIVAAGRPGLIKAEHVSEHAVVIDVGINPMTGADGRVHMVGDVDFDSVAPRVRAITSVPGGVGPVTDVWLVHNTVLAARLRAGRSIPDPNHLVLEAL